MGKNSLTGPLERISWDETLPTNTDVEFQVAFSNDREGPWSYIGPDGTSGTVFTTAAGEDFDASSDFEGRYARFKAVLSTSDGLETPSFGNVHLSFSGEGMLASEVRTYQYDEAGNIEMVTTVTDAGSSTDARTHNDLNQIEEQVVGGDTWTFSYDDNGNMTGKTNGTDTWTYSWNDENRLIRVQGPGSVDVRYTYDSIGRMLTRDDGTDVTQFTWDHWDCIRETTGMSTTTYCIPEGVLTSFIRDGDRFDVHTDALGSVRMITDEAGEMVARYEYGAFGAIISSSETLYVPGLSYQFLGSEGIRLDALTGLYYIRHRWYNAKLGRFISADPYGLSGSLNLYVYGNNNPSKYLDQDGRRAVLSRDLIQLCRQLGYSDVERFWQLAVDAAILRVENECSCPNWPKDINYLEALQTDRWNVTFQKMPHVVTPDSEGLPFDEWAGNQAWMTRSENKVWGSGSFCARISDSTIDVLSNQIIHELTHAGQWKNWKALPDSDPRKALGPYPEDVPYEGDSSHPNEYFKNGIDRCRKPISQYPRK